MKEKDASFLEIFTQLAGKRALIVYTPSVEIGSKLMKDLFEYYGYLTQLLNAEHLTRRDLENQLERLAENTNSCSQTIFYYCGHGVHAEDKPIILDSEGLSLNNGSKEHIFRPSNFYSKIGKIRGKKAIILDACHSGLFIDYIKYQAIISDYVVIAACPAQHETPVMDWLKNVSKEEKLKHNIPASDTLEVSLLTGTLIGSIDDLAKKAEYRGRPRIDLSTITIAPLFSLEQQRAIKEAAKSRGFSLSFEVQRVYDTAFIL